LGGRVVYNEYNRQDTTKQEDREMSIDDVVKEYQAGRITEDEARKFLDKMDTRGAFGANGSYIGYNYRYQTWIDIK